MAAKKTIPHLISILMAAFLAITAACEDETPPPSTPTPISTPATSTPSLDIRVSAALDKQTQGRFHEAGLEFESVISEDPKQADAYYGRARSNVTFGRNELAIADLAILLNPGDARYHWLRGVASEALGKLDQALSDYDESIRLDPNKAISYNNRGTIRYSLGNYRLAIRDFSKAIGIEGYNPTYLSNRALAFTALGLNHFADRDMDFAVGMGADPIEIEILLETLRQ